MKVSCEVICSDIKDQEHYHKVLNEIARQLVAIAGELSDGTKWEVVTVTSSPRRERILANRTPSLSEVKAPRGRTINTSKN